MKIYNSKIIQNVFENILINGENIEELEIIEIKKFDSK